MTDRVIVVTAAGDPAEAVSVAAAVAVAIGAELPQAPVVLVDGVGGRRWTRTLLASPVAVAAERRLRRGGFGGAVARGRLCVLDRTEVADWWEIAGEAEAGCVVVALPAERWWAAIAGTEKPVDGAVLRAGGSLAALAVDEALAAGVPIKVVPEPGRLAARRAIAGAEPAGRGSPRFERAARSLVSQRAQSTVLFCGVAAAVATTALAFAAVTAAVTGKGRMQRAADLSALSAARSMRNDFDRLFVPALRPDGTPDPGHLDRSRYLDRARAAAKRAARLNGAAPGTLRIVFPDADSMAPVRVRAELPGRVDLPGPRTARAQVYAEARISTGADAIAAPAPVTSGGGYSGRLAYRQGKPMRPDVARAFDAMSRAASRGGVALVVNSGFRSDAEQARLFAAHPDPRWVAPPGRSLHRCGTELDLGPPGSQAWLAHNAPRFGFAKRYAWEPWHFGYVRGDRPCGPRTVDAAAGEHGDRGAEDDPGPRSVPSFVPARYREAIEASAARNDVSASLLAAQLMAESNFNPAAVSAAGARGIAQFMPATARSYGLPNPLDPIASIAAQGRLMGSLLRQFGSAGLALAAYNAGPEAVRRFGGVPPYAETRAYVARVLALAGGGGITAPAPAMEVELVD